MTGATNSDRKTVSEVQKVRLRFIFPPLRMECVMDRTVMYALPRGRVMGQALDSSGRGKVAWVPRGPSCFCRYSMRVHEPIPIRDFSPSQTCTPLRYLGLRG